MTTYQITRTVADVTTVIAQGLDAHDAAERLLSEAGAQYDVVEDCGDESEVVIETASGKEIYFQVPADEVMETICRHKLRRDGALYQAVAMTTYQITRTVDGVTSVIAQGLDADAAADALIAAAGADYEVEDGYFADHGVFIDEPGIRVTLASGKEIWRDCEPGDEAAAILSLRLRRDGALYLAVAE